MKTGLKRALIAGVVLAAAPALAQQNPAWTSPAEPFRIIDNVYSVGTAGLPTYLITTPQGHVLLDVGLAQNVALVEANIAKLRFRLRDVKFLLSSHAHFDHAGGLARLKADTGALLVAAEDDRYALENGVYPGSEVITAYRFPPVQVDTAVRDGYRVVLGGIAFTAHITPGHTKGCTTWTWPVKDRDGSLHTAIDFCSASVAANSLSPEQYPGIVADYKRTFATAAAIPGDVFLAPHAEQFDLAAKKARLGRRGPNPFIDRAGYEALVRAQQADFEAKLATATRTKP